MIPWLQGAGMAAHIRGDWTLTITMVFVAATTLVVMFHEFLPLAIVLALATDCLIAPAFHPRNSRLQHRHDGAGTHRHQLQACAENPRYPATER